MPNLVFPPMDAPEFKEAMERNQALAARTAYTVDSALEPINAVMKQPRPRDLAAAGSALRPDPGPIARW